MLSQMPLLLNGDRAEVAELFGQVICNYLEVLQSEPKLFPFLE
jgi:hypothetical protein